MATQKQKIEAFNSAEEDGRFTGFLEAGFGDYSSEGKYRLDKPNDVWSVVNN